MDKNRVKKRSNIISLKMNADFYVDRAFHSLDRFRYDKARRYVTRAIELDPLNPVNHCNLAGILSEMGKYEESNRILHDVIENIDPTLTECYFYLANNYANLDDFEMAEDYAIRYLEAEKNGEFTGEAEEMLDFISIELQGSTRRKPKFEYKDELVKTHESACRLMETGKFAEAANKLERLIEESPDFFAGKNNLALAYFYLGEFDKAKTTVESLLAKDPFNLHALCNLALFYQQEENDPVVDKLLNVLRKIVPIDVEHTHKLATTLGILGEHEAALHLFIRLIKDNDMADYTLYHCVAVSSVHLGKYDLAEKMWKMSARIDRETGIPEKYLQLLEIWKAEQMHTFILPYIPYHYRLPDNLK